MRWLASATLCLALCACGGGGGLEVSKAPPARNAAALTQDDTVSGVSYARSDSIAYEAHFVPPSGLPGAQVSLAGATAITNGIGQFSLPAPANPGEDALALDVSLPGSMSTTLPWLASDPKTALGIGMYPAVATAPRPGFVTGVVTMDAGGYIQNMFAENLFVPTYERIKTMTGANLVAYPDPAWLLDFDTLTPSVSIVAGSSTIGGPTPLQYAGLVQESRARGMQFMMMLGIEPGSLPGHPSIWEVPASNTAFWAAFFAAYQPVVLQKAALARDLGIEWLALGYNRGYMVQMGGTARWRQLIEAVRGVGYTGKVTYIGMATTANAQHDFAVFSPEARNEFLALFDAIGLSVYDGIKKDTPDEVLAPAQTRARMRSSLTTLFATLSDAPVPLLVMIGTPSVHGGVVNGEYIEPCLGCGSVAPQRTRDYLQQADLYQAAAEVIAAMPVGNGRVMGLLSWGYHFRDNPYRSWAQGDSAYDKSANVRGKPAEAVLGAWFRKWAPPAVDRVFNWGEVLYPDLFPLPATAGRYGPYTYRYYPGSGLYLAEANGRIYLHNGTTLVLHDVGALSGFFSLAQDAGY
ncbi:MAG: hypothetical protein HY854_05880 [Burkholderiales bacterium]|nr:hypothetical protein [Burkholderiales bacterium]